MAWCRSLALADRLARISSKPVRHDRPRYGEAGWRGTMAEAKAEKKLLHTIDGSLPNFMQ